MTAVEVPFSWPVALHPDARPIPRSERVVDVVLGGDAVRLESEQPGLPRVTHRLLREQPLGALVAANRRDGFTPEGTAEILARLGQGGMLRRLAQPRLSDEELRDFEREIGALARHESEAEDRFELFSRVRRAHVIVVGCGLGGARVVEHLAASGVGHLSLVDPAEVLPSQAGRHPWFTRRDVGRGKADVLRDAVHDASPHTGVRSLQRAITSEAELETVLASVPAIDALVYTLDVDNLAFGIWAARQARARRFALLRVNRIVVGPLTRPGRDEACPGCIAPRLERGVRALSTVLSLAGDERDETAFLFASELAAFGALAAHEVFSYLTGVGEPACVDRQLAPAPGGGYREIKPFPREPECPACGGSGTC